MKNLGKIFAVVLCLSTLPVFAGTPIPEVDTVVAESVTIEEIIAEEIVFAPEKIQNTSCSDTLYLKDGRVIPITFISQTGLSIKFKKCDDPINRTWRKEKTKIQKLVYADGKVDDFNQSGSDNRNSSENSPNAAAAVVGGTMLAVAVGIVVSAGVAVWILLTSF